MMAEHDDGACDGCAAEVEVTAEQTAARLKTALGLLARAKPLIAAKGGEKLWLDVDAFLADPVSAALPIAQQGEPDA